VTDKYAFIRGEEGDHDVRKMCRWAGVSRSGYLAWRGRKPSRSATWRANLTEVVIKIFTDSDRTYGYRRVHAAAARLGWPADPQTIRAIMAEQGLHAVCTRKHGPRTTITAAAVDVPDLLDRDFTSDTVGHKLVGDITYIPTWEGFAYLATALDCATKKVVGYAIADHLRTDLIVDALAMAARNGNHHPRYDHLRLRPRHPVHVRPIRRLHQPTRHPAQRRTHRYLLRQRVGRIVQRHPQS